MRRLNRRKVLFSGFGASTVVPLLSVAKTLTPKSTPIKPLSARGGNSPSILTENVAYHRSAVREIVTERI